MNEDTMEFSQAYKEAKERLTIPQLWEKLGLPGVPKKKCKSPFRDESSPSFSISRKDTYWKDHGIGKGGDIFDFYQMAMDCTKPEAARAIFEMVGLKAENQGYGWSRPSKKPEVVSLTNPNEFVESRIEFYPQLPEEAYPFLLAKGISPLVADSLIREGSLDVEAGKLVFCYNTGKKIRPSWESSKDNRWIEGGADDALWRYQEVLRPEVSVVFVCEGESDAMRVLSAVPIPPHVAVVAAPAASWRPSSVLASTIGHGRKVILAFDNDEAGELAAEKVGEAIWEACFFNAEIRRFPWQQIEKVLSVLGIGKPKDLCDLTCNVISLALNSCFEA